MMKNTRKPNNKLSKGCIAAIVICGVSVAFLTWLVMRIVNTDSSLNTVVTYVLPKFSDLDGMPRLESGTYAVTVDGEIATGQKSQEIHPTASMAKMILGLAIMQKKPFELGEPGETLTISEEDYALYKSYLQRAGTVSEVKVGEEISEYDALASVMLVSSNNMADTLAKWAFGSLDDYQEYASEMVRGWGLANTVIGADASGFDPGTTSTASDMAKIGTLVMQNPVLKEIVALKEYEIPVAGVITNTNMLLGRNNISGVKTGYIGEMSGYCLTSAYLEEDHIIVTTLMGSPSRDESFENSLKIIRMAQEKLPVTKLLSKGDVIGYYDSWWTGHVNITADDDVYGIGWDDAVSNISLNMHGHNGTLEIQIGGKTYSANVTADTYTDTPTFIDRFLHAFNWKNNSSSPTITSEVNTENSSEDSDNPAKEPADDFIIDAESLIPITSSASDNCTIRFGKLMLINPNFTVDNNFIANRKIELISLSEKYGIKEGLAGNGDNLLDAEAASHINDMVQAYEAEYPGHTLETRSCFRSVGTNCGRLCAATGASDHHTGLTCDLIDPVYGTTLDTDTYTQHVDWQWLKANSYKYGFIDRFPEAWAGGPMSEPLNVDGEGTTGLYETWHYRYVGIEHATNIASGKYNNGEYDSLEHYLKVRGLIDDLKAGTCK